MTFGESSKSPWAVAHICGHYRNYSRPTWPALIATVNYAETTLCWHCWLEHRDWDGSV